MVKQLGSDEQLKSIEAVKSFKKKCIGDSDHKVEAEVIVLDIDEEDEDNYFHKNFVDVYVMLNTNIHNVHIMWEQIFGESFKNVESEIYGTYSTSYNKMRYSHKELTIYSDQRKIIIRA